MATILKGQTVTLYTKTQTGTDGFNRPTCTESAVLVYNVLIGQPTQEEQAEMLNLTGRRIAFTLGIPKGDQHDWLNTRVEFFGRTFRQIGEIVEGQPELIPLDWNKKVYVEQVDGR